MRALKNGKEIKYYTICPECSSHLEYGYDDIQKAGGTNTGSKYIVCPICEERIVLNTPSSVLTASPFSSLASSVSNCCVK